MRVRSATEAAPGRPANEDAVFVDGELVGVLDGVTAPEGLDNGCAHTVAWYVQRLVDRLTQAHTAAPRQPLTATLHRAIELVRGDHGPGCDLSHPAAHAATLTLLRQRGTVLDYLVLCDATLVLDRHDGVEVITDPRFAQAVADIRARALSGASADGATGDQDLMRRVAIERSRLTNREDGYWIAAADPAAADHAITGVAQLDGPNAVVRAALLTDGAANLVDRFHRLDWPGLLDLAANMGPAEVLVAVRTAELHDPYGQENPRYKRHDDATIALCTFEGDQPVNQPSRHSVSVAGVVINDDGQVLVVQRRDNGKWEIPGGVLELDEPIHTGLRREVLEETGVHVAPGPLTGVYKNMKVGVVALVFRASQAGGEPVPTDESATVAWWTADQVREHMLPAYAVRVLDALDFKDTVAVREHDGVNLLDC